MWISNTLLAVLLFSLGATTENNILRCYEGSFSTYTDFSLSNPTPLLSSSCYDSSKDTVFYTYGFNGKNNGESVQAIVEAYLPLNYNVVLVGWEKAASSGILNELVYPINVSNALRIGRQFGRALLSLIEAGLRLIGIRLIGFSLGAHFMSEAAKEVQTTGRNITILIGLDPAGPLFSGLISLRGINPTNADFVIILHTNRGRLGIDESRGHVDVWVNCGGPVQPGCEAAEGGTIGLLPVLATPENLCSHNRTWQNYKEALQRPNTFIARSASSCDAWRAGNGSNLTITISVNIDNTLRGNFYLSTNSAPFYGRGEAGANPI